MFLREQFRLVLFPSDGCVVFTFDGAAGASDGATVSGGKSRLDLRSSRFAAFVVTRTKCWIV